MRDYGGKMSVFAFVGLLALLFKSVSPMEWDALFCMNIQK